MHKIFTVGPDHLLPSITPSTRSAPPASAGRAREPHHVIRSYLLVAGTGPVSCGRRRAVTPWRGASGGGRGGRRRWRRPRAPRHVILSSRLVAGRGPVACGRRRPVTIRSVASSVRSRGSRGTSGAITRGLGSGLGLVFVLVAGWV